MNIDDAFPDPQKNELFYQPQNGFWEGLDRLDFETKNLEQEWPASKNLFVARMAMTLMSGAYIPEITLENLKFIIGDLVRIHESTAYRLIVVPLGRSGRSFAVSMKSKSHCDLAPIASDNACSFELAAKWMAYHKGAFEMTVCPDGCFWVHR